MNQPITPWLHIVIPCRNRAHVLRENLPLILKQANDSGVLVSCFDNASTDDTQALLTELCKEFPSLEYRRHAENIGLDRNMLTCMENIRAPYVFWLGDDDLIAPGALVQINSILKQEPDLLLLNMKTDANHTVRNSETIHCNDPLRFFENHAFHIPFGTSIFKAEWTRLIPRAERFIGTYHAYSGLIFDALAEQHVQGKPCKIYLAGEALVSSVPTEKSWSASKADVYLNGIPRWFDLLHPIYDAVNEQKRLEYLMSDAYQRIACESGHTSHYLLQQIKHLNSQLTEEKSRNHLLEQRLSSMLTPWTWLGWRLLPWTKPKWRRNPLGKEKMPDA